MILHALKVETPGRKDAAWNCRIALAYLCMHVMPGIEVVRINAKRMADELEMPLRTCTGLLQRLVDAGLIELGKYQYGPDRRYELRIDPESNH